MALPPCMKVDESHYDEDDASQVLKQHIEGLVAPSAPNPTAGSPNGAGPGLSGAGLAASGESPNFLSKNARHRMAAYSRQTGCLSVALAAVLTGVIPVIQAVAIKDGGSASQSWVAGVVAIVLFGCLCMIVSFFTVMGFSKVNISMQMPGLDLPAPPLPPTNGTKVGAAHGSDN